MRTSWRFLFIASPPRQFSCASHSYLSCHNSRPFPHNHPCVSVFSRFLLRKCVGSAQLFPTSVSLSPVIYNVISALLQPNYYYSFILFIQTV